MRIPAAVLVPLSYGAGLATGLLHFGAPACAMLIPIAWVVRRFHERPVGEKAVLVWIPKHELAGLERVLGAAFPPNAFRDRLRNAISEPEGLDIANVRRVQAGHQFDPGVGEFRDSLRRECGHLLFVGGVQHQDCIHRRCCSAAPPPSRRVVLVEVAEHTLTVRRCHTFAKLIRQPVQ